MTSHLLFGEPIQLETHAEFEAVATDLLSNLACRREKRLESRDRAQRIDALIERLSQHGAR